MKVLQFAWNVEDTTGVNDYLPHNYGENCVVYTGTHDNETIVGWFEGIKEEERQMAREYLCDPYTPDDQIHKPFVSVAMLSRAFMCIIPIQDYMEKGRESRINTPQTVGNNWKWRIDRDAISPQLCQLIRSVTKMYGRC